MPRYAPICMFADKLKSSTRCTNYVRIRISITQSTTSHMVYFATIAVLQLRYAGAQCVLYTTTKIYIFPCVPEHVCALFFMVISHNNSLGHMDSRTFIYLCEGTPPFAHRVRAHYEREPEPAERSHSSNWQFLPHIGYWRQWYSGSARP